MGLSKEALALGFPIIHAHKLACLRQELIDAFVESRFGLLVACVDVQVDPLFSRYMMFIKYAAVQLQQLGLKKQMDLFNGGGPGAAGNPQLVNKTAEEQKKLDNDEVWD